MARYIVGRYKWTLPLLGTAIVAILPFAGALTYARTQELMLAAVYTLIVAGFNLSFGCGGQLALSQVAVFAGGGPRAVGVHRTPHGCSASGQATSTGSTYPGAAWHLHLNQ